MLEQFSIILLFVFIYVNLGFILSILWKRNDIADVLWGPGIFLSILAGTLTSNSINWAYYFPIFTLTFLWALRIFLHIGTRFWHKTEEDARYKVWRDTWKYFYTRSYFQVFILQGMLMVVVGSGTVILANSSISLVNHTIVSILYYLGILISISGLLLEGIADWQLKNFLSDPSNKGKILTEGVWGWRLPLRPNYLGELSFWWGIFIASIPILNIFTIISPLTISSLILFVSGLPMLSKKFGGKR